jgi:trehalose/maltose hydrolase-like predicted phosphorylase
MVLISEAQAAAEATTVSKFVDSAKNSLRSQSVSQSVSRCQSRKQFTTTWLHKFEMSSQINKTSRAESNVEKVYKYTSAANKCTRVDKVVWAVLSESTAGGQATEALASAQRPGTRLALNQEP